MQELERAHMQRGHIIFFFERGILYKYDCERGNKDDTVGVGLVYGTELEPRKGIEARA